jgi:hypothetical protein
MYRTMIAIGVALAALATGCGRPVAAEAPLGPVPTPSGEPVVHPRWTSCAVDAGEALAGAEGIALPRLDAGFTAAAAVVCDQIPERRDDGGEYLVAVESRTEDVARLVEALRLPDQPRTDDTCSMDLPGVAWFALLDGQGRWVRPGLPMDVCGKIRIEVRQAVQQLRLTRVSSRVIQEIVSAEANAAGCSQGWANIVAMEAGDAQPGSGRDPFPAGKRIRLCVYRVPPDQMDSNKPAGDFRHGGLLSPTRQAAIEKAITSAPPAVPCARPATTFALLVPADQKGDEIYVELDGCRRILLRGGGLVLAQGDAALVALLQA